MATTVLNVPTISCERCERTITNALQPVDGVRTVRVDIGAHQVHVDFDETRVSVPSRPTRTNIWIRASNHRCSSAVPGGVGRLQART